MKTNVIIIIILIFTLYGCGNTCEKWLNNNLKNEIIIGKIEKVELHHKQHDAQFVHVKYSDGSIRRFDFYGTKFDFLYYIRKGDQIFKEKGSLRVKIERTFPTKEIKYFNIDCLTPNDPVPIRYQ